MTGQGFPPQLRIRRGGEYRALSRSGRRFHTRNLVIQYRPGRGDTSRFGVTVSRKVGKAVVRNRIKRWVREYARTHALCLGRAWDVVVIARPSAGRCAHGELDEQLDELWAYLKHRGGRGVGTPGERKGER